MLCKVNVKHCRWGNTPSLPWRLEVAASHWRDATPSAQRGRWEKQKSMQQNADNSLNETHCQSQEISARQQNKTKHEAKSTQKWFQNNTVCSWSPELVSGRCCSLHPHATWQSLSSFAKCGEECSVIMSLSSLFFFFYRHCITFWDAFHCISAASAGCNTADWSLFWHCLANVSLNIYLDVNISKKMTI